MKPRTPLKDSVTIDIRVAKEVKDYYEMLAIRNGSSMSKEVRDTLVGRMTDEINGIAKRELDPVVDDAAFFYSALFRHMERIKSDYIAYRKFLVIVETMYDQATIWGAKEEENE